MRNFTIILKKNIEAACATSENQKSSHKLNSRLVSTSAYFAQIKCPEVWADFRCDRLARRMSRYEYQNKYTCPSCQKRICKQVFKMHYVQFIYYGKCLKINKKGYIVH